MKWMTLFLFALSLNAFADCTPVNLVTEANSPFNKIPVYDQDGSFTCYAYSAAPFMDYHLIKRGASKRAVHPAWLALNYAQQNNAENYATGHADLSILAVMRSGNCDYEKVSSALSRWANAAKVRESDVLALIERFSPRLKEIQEAKTPGEALTRRDIETAFNLAVADHSGFCPPGSEWENILPEISNFYETSVQLVGRMTSAACGPADRTPVRLPRPTVIHRIRSMPTDALVNAQLERKLSANTGPLSVTYCSKFLYTPGHDGITDTNQLTADCALHESMVVGKKAVGGSCHFLLRNSWGSGWNIGSRNWKCLCKHKTTGAMVDDCQRSTHNDGNYTVEGCWLPEDVLSKNVRSILTLENPPSIMERIRSVIR